MSPALEHWSSTLLSHVNIGALLFLFTLCCLAKVLQNQRHLSNIPPGPRPWPIVGNYGGFLVPSFLRRRFRRGGGAVKNAIVLLTDQANIYGNVFSLFVGSQLIVVLNGYEVVKDALSNHADDFSDRPDIPTVSIMTKRKGDTVSELTILIRFKIHICNWDQ